MNHRGVTAFTLALLFGAPATPMLSQAPDSLIARLDTSYKLTRMGFGGSSRVTAPGSVYVVQIDGLLARAITDHVTPTTTIKDGKALPSAKGFIGAFGAIGNTRPVASGDRFYVDGIDLKNDAIIFRLVSLDTHVVEANGDSVQSRFRMLIKFPLAPGTADTLTAASVHKLTDPIFSVPGAPEPTPQVQLGETLPDVQKAFGQPDKIVDLGPKQILSYGSLTIIFVDGKVTDAR